jgi:tetratricopeptide (TPR) repeat protein
MTMTQPIAKELNEEALIHFQQAEELRQQGNLEEAIAAYHQVIQIQPDMGLAYHKLGDTLLKLKQWQAAETCVRQVLEIEPDLDWFHYQLGEALAGQQRWHEAIAAYQQATTLNPDFLYSYQKLGTALLQLQQWDKAAECFLRAIEIEPDYHWAHYQLGEALAGQQAWEKAVSAYGQVVQLQPEWLYGHYQLGVALKQLKQWQEAVQCFKTAISLDPNFCWSYYCLGEALAQLEQWEASISYYHQGLELNPDGLEYSHAFVKALIHQGHLYAQRGEIESAIASYQEAVQWQPEQAICFEAGVEQVPSNEKTYQNLAKALITHQQWVAAALACRKAIALNPDSFWSYNSLGDALLKQEKWLEAVKAYQQAVKINPNHSWSYYNQGDAFCKLEYWEQAVSAYQQAVKLNAEHPWSHFKLGDSLSKLDRWQEAIVAYREALRLQPDISTARQKLANALQHQGLLYVAEAAQEYNQILQRQPDQLSLHHQALSINPNHPELYLNLGNSLIRHSRFKAALLYYKMALQIHPDATELPLKLEQSLVSSSPAEKSEIFTSYYQLLQTQIDVPDFYFKLGNLLQEQNDLESAVSFYQRFLDLKLTYAEIYFQLGNVLVKEYQLEDSINAYQRAIELNPNKSWYHKGLGDSLATICEFDAAILAYEKAIELEPAHQSEFLESLNKIKQQKAQWDKLTKYCEQVASDSKAVEYQDESQRPLRILMVTTYPPYPPNTGGAIRMFEKIKYMGQHHQVVVVSYIFDQAEYAQVEVGLADYCDLSVLVMLGTPLSEKKSNEPTKVHQWKTWQMWKTLEKLKAVKFDVVTFDFIFIASYKELFSHTYTILEEHNIESNLLMQCHTNVRQSDVDQASEKSGAMQEFRDAEQEYKLLTAYENQVWSSFDLRTVVSEGDKQEMKNRCAKEIILVKNGVDTKTIPLIDNEQGDKLFYMGHMTYYPNVDAVCYFVNKVLPILWLHDPTIRFCIAGRHPAPQVQELTQDSRIELVANPDNMSDVAKDCMLTVVPLRLGSGTRLKILHAMAMGLPVVSTTLGAEGLSVIDGTDILIRDQPEAFAEAVIQLRSNAELRKKIKMKGRQLVEQEYDWSSVFSEYEQQIFSRIN